MRSGCVDGKYGWTGQRTTVRKDLRKRWRHTVYFTANKRLNESVLVSSVLHCYRKKLQNAEPCYKTDSSTLSLLDLSQSLARLSSSITMPSYYYGDDERAFCAMCNSPLIRYYSKKEPNNGRWVPLCVELVWIAWCLHEPLISFHRAFYRCDECSKFVSKLIVPFLPWQIFNYTAISRLGERTTPCTRTSKLAAWRPESKSIPEQHRFSGI